MKFKKIITIVITVLAVGMPALSGAMKIAGGAQGAGALEKVGMGEHWLMLGIAEIVFAALFAYPKTMKIGFLLLASYFSGALATEISHSMTTNALVPLVIIWGATFLRDKSIFLQPDQIER